MMGKMKEARQKSDEVKKRLKTSYVRHVTSENQIEIVANGNKELIELNIHENLLEDKEQLEDELIVAINRAMEKAGALYESEMKDLVKDYLPNIPGLSNMM